MEVIMIIILIVPAIALIPVIYKCEQLYYKTDYYDILPDILIIRKGYNVHLATADNTSQFYAHIDGVEEENAAE